MEMPVESDFINVLWFLLLGILLTGYAILDGFDLGVGILHPLARKDSERRVFMNSIGPLWDGNEVWLVTFGGALLAAFPNAYATAFEWFYLAFILLLFCLIGRAVSMEFRSKRDSPAWRTFFDYSFFASSGLAALLFGVAVGNAMRGVPIQPDLTEAAGLGFQRFLQLLRPYPILVGLFTVAIFAMHGSIYLYLKTTGEIQQRVHGWMWRTFGFFLVAYLFLTIYTLVEIPHAVQNFREHPWMWLVPALNVLAIANIPRAIHLNRPGYAFVSSACSIAAFVFLFGVALYPNMVTSSIHPDYSLTIYNASSSDLTLRIMAIIAFIGMPFVLAYTAVIYWTFRGKVEIGRFSY